MASDASKAELSEAIDTMIEEVRLKGNTHACFPPFLVGNRFLLRNFLSRGEVLSKCGSSKTVRASTVRAAIYSSENKDISASLTTTYSLMFKKINIIQKAYK